MFAVCRPKLFLFTIICNHDGYGRSFLAQTFAVWATKKDITKLYKTTSMNLGLVKADGITHAYPLKKTAMLIYLIKNRIVWMETAVNMVDLRERKLLQICKISTNTSEQNFTRISKHNNLSLPLFYIYKNFNHVATW